MKRVTSIIINWYDCSCRSVNDIGQHTTNIYRRTKRIKHLTYNGLSVAPANTYNYRIEKNACEDFFWFLENTVKISNWEKDYSVFVCDGWSWEVIVRYSDRSKQIAVGTVIAPPFGEDIEKRIRKLVKFEETVLIFGYDD